MGVYTTVIYEKVILQSDDGTIHLIVGTGNPNGVVPAPVGSKFFTSTAEYRKGDTSTNTGWFPSSGALPVSTLVSLSDIQSNTWMNGQYSYAPIGGTVIFTNVDGLSTIDVYLTKTSSTTWSSKDYPKNNP